MYFKGKLLSAMQCVFECQRRLQRDGLSHAQEQATVRLCTPQLQLTLVSLMSVASPMANTLDWPATCSLSFTCTAHEGTLPAAHSMYMCQGHRLLTVQSFKVKASGHQLHGARKPGMISSASHFQSLSHCAVHSAAMSDGSSDSCTLMAPRASRMPSGCRNAVFGFPPKALYTTSASRRLPSVKCQLPSVRCAAFSP